MTLINILLIILVSAILVCYITLATQPAELAYFISNKFAKRISNKDPSGFWKLFGEIKDQHFTIVSLLIFLILLAGIINFVLFTKINSADILPDHYFLILVAGVLIFIYGLVKFFFYGKVAIPETKHGLTEKAKSILDTLSITAGISSPLLVVVAHSNPSTFSVKKNLKQTAIYITSAFLNLCTENELQAVLAWELAHHIERRNSFMRLINNLILLFEILGFAMTFLILYNINQQLPLIAVIIFLFSYVRLSVAGIGSMFLGSINLSGESLIRLINPALAIATFLAFLIKYSLSFRETVAADLKAVDLTRYPAGLHTILRKLQTPNNNSDLLPEEFADLYFTGEAAVRRNLPMFQASISERLNILEKIDSSLQTNLNNNTEVKIYCPICNTEFKKQPITIYDKEISYYSCSGNYHFWFDNSSLYQISAPGQFKNTELIVNYQAEHKVQNCICPRCKIPLTRQNDPFLPTSVDIWNCSSCQGDLISSEDFAKYVNYRTEKESKKS